MKQERGPEGPLPKHQFGKDLECLFLDLGSLAETIPQVVQLRAANLALTDGLDHSHVGRMQGEDLLAALPTLSRR